MKLTKLQCSPLALACVAGGILMGGAAIVPVFAENDFQPRPERNQRQRSGANLDRAKHHMIREGTVLTNRGGNFRLDGDGAVLVAEDGVELGALPNLNLERVMRSLNSSDEPESIRWVVSGTVTEYNGRNFLLISRAVFKSAAAPPPLDVVEP